MVNPEEYNASVLDEEIETYGPGGFHPIHLKDRFKDGRYEILGKLGVGGFSTVWLARDYQEDRNVSLKVARASITSNKAELDRKLQVLRTISEGGDPSHPGRKFVSRLLDWFYHDGPNGRHCCTVQEPLGQRLSNVISRADDQGIRFDHTLARRVSKQVLYAISFLHSCGIAHGDIHLGNVLFHTSRYQKTPQELEEAFGKPKIVPVRRKDGLPNEMGLPQYLVSAMPDFEEYGISGTWDEDDETYEEVKLIDFDQSFYITNPPVKLSAPGCFRAPEIIFERPLTEALDIWSLGCLTFQIMTGQPCFEVGYWGQGFEIPPWHEGLTGTTIPQEWLQDAKAKGYTGELIGEKAFIKPLEGHLHRAYFEMYPSDYLRDRKIRPPNELGEADLKLLSQYLQKMLIIDPAQRESAKTLCTEDWILGAS
ncbi:MAG: hypothetical protein M1814_006157 [Vezdaea aestivalis]|nr:MAG: hypothetical protein M1814_006157 [Vezdaea aestivalis]